MKIPGMLFCVMWIAGLTPVALAAGDSPWGSARLSDASYRPHRVLYDVTTGDEQEMMNILDRVSYLGTRDGNDPSGMSIVIIVHGNAIPFFTRERLEMYKDIMTRAHSLTVGNPVEFRMCQAAARTRGLSPADIHGFVTMVPMADAEIIRLQQEEGYAYLQ